MKNTFISLCILLSVNAQDLVSTNIDLIGSVKFKLDFVERCHAGDLNLIYSELLKDLPERERVILSVEPIQNKFSGSSTLINNSVVIDDPNIRELLKKEVDLDLQIVNGFTGVAGIFICKDGDNDQKCRNNIAKDFNKAMKVYQIPASKFDKDGILIGGIKQREKIEDKIYFFRPVIIKNGKLYS